MKALRIFLAATAILLAGLTAHAANITLTSDNTVAIRSEIDATSISKAQMELLELVAKRGAKNTPIFLVMDSPGGDIEAGLNFIEFAKTIPNLHTVTLFAASMASGIVEALPGNRYILETGVLMFHRAKGGVDGQFEDGEVESRLTFFKKWVRGMEQKNADRMKLSLASYKAQVKDEMWILGKESVDKNAADAVVTVSCSNELAQQKKVVEVHVFVFVIPVEYSGCPLIRGGTVLSKEKEHKEAYIKYLNQTVLGYKWKN